MRYLHSYLWADIWYGTYLEDNEDEDGEEQEEVYAEDYDDTDGPPLPLPFMKPAPPPTTAPAFVDRTKHIVSISLFFFIKESNQAIGK